MRTLGRLSDPVEFGNIVVKQTTDAVVRIKDVARVELAAQDYSSASFLNRDPSVAIAVFQRPGSNALTTGEKIRTTMADISQILPGRDDPHHHLRSDPVHPANRSMR